jgi:hypothetical protein
MTLIGASAVTWSLGAYAQRPKEALSKRIGLLSSIIVSRLLDFSSDNYVVGA